MSLPDESLAGHPWDHPSTSDRPNGSIAYRMTADGDFVRRLLAEGVWHPPHPKEDLGEETIGAVQN